MTSQIEKACDKNIAVHQPGLKPEQMTQMYDEWAKTYDKDLEREGKYIGLDYAAEALKALYPDNPENVRVLDVAAGTGLLGEKLHNLGFRQIDGLDPSPGMLEACKRKGVYKTLICEYMTENPSNIQTDSYDCIGICGGMGESHIPKGALREMIRIVKPGGYICIMMMKFYLDKAEQYKNNQLDDYMDGLQQDGRWKKIERTVKPDYSFGNDGVLFVFKVL